MRDDGWFIEQANPAKLEGMRNPDGSPRLDWKGILGYQISDKDLADFIVRACNCHAGLLETLDGLSGAIDMGREQSDGGTIYAGNDIEVWLDKAIAVIKKPVNP